ncbi:MAG: 4Fe-4S dicluster domain-containing protein [Magnetococcales bacterium]|nr:4Fe-4S dicluster domain-containing protein [Magnetococcales bacterium]MBF0151406.1 4Fe-4S dicluster domain-containing protein [Magnetococcales bacterium]MBF0174332.1 4Fe-4S dicluster domain-containing protein [Magnetococcales bacterium]
MKPVADAPASPIRRHLLKGVAFAATAAAGSAVAAESFTSSRWADTLDRMLQKHFLKMSPEEVRSALERIQRDTERIHGIKSSCSATPPPQQVRFAQALNLAVCKGTRRCVEACVRENNCGRGGALENIRVLAMNQGSHDLALADPYFNPPLVPEPGRHYLPVSCQQCDHPPCVQACPVQATWKEPDGIVVIDYDWCIGCRYCAIACPYGARHFNWGRPDIPPGDCQPRTDYLGNRPRPAGVMEKCTFCLQRTRNGLLPACLEACPTGARIFGNLLDPASEIRYVLEHKPVYRLKEEMGTSPGFWYFTG